jgi:triosephosphate isomerase
MLIAGNWKMNGGQAALAEIGDLIGMIKPGGPSVLVCPPATLISRMAELVAGYPIAIGGQDCHPEPNGAHTGDVSAEQLRDAGASSVILGHSERRADHGETDALVKAKAQAAFRAGLRAIICVGETADQRAQGRTIEIVTSQLSGSLPPGTVAGDISSQLVVAYEPVWAIGTGLVPTLEDIAAVHAAIRVHLGQSYGPRGTDIDILYGGSVKPDNAATILRLANVGGALVGGASLKAKDFATIINAA